VRQALEAWGRAQPALPLGLEKPGRTQAEPPRCWHGPSVRRRVEGEYRDARVTPAALRFVVGHASQLAQPQAQTYTSAQGKEAEAVTDHATRVQAQGLACLPAAEAARAASEGREQGRRGRRPRPWRSHAGHDRMVAETRRTRRARRGRPAKTDPRPTESGYRLVVEGEALANAEAHVQGL
jgi:hypothetical protein